MALNDIITTKIKKGQKEKPNLTQAFQNNYVGLQFTQVLQNWHVKRPNAGGRI